MGMKLEAIRQDRTRGGRSTYQCSYTLPSGFGGHTSPAKDCSEYMMDTERSRHQQLIPDLLEVRILLSPLILRLLKHCSLKLSYFLKTWAHC